MGTVTAQIITLIAIPILTRIYSVESFGLLGIYIAISNIARAIFSFRYDFAIPTAKTNKEASQILWLTIIISACICIFLSALIQVFSISYLEKFGNIQYLLPFMLFISSLDNIFTLWLNRIKQYRIFSSSRVIRATTIALAQIAIGYQFGIFEGLIYGVLIGELLTLFFLLFGVLTSKIKMQKPSIKRIIYTLKRHKDNPIYLLPGHSLNTLTSQLPIIVVENFFGQHMAGIMYMAIKIVSLPSQLISSAAFKVFFSEAAKLYNASGSCYSLTKKTILGAIIISIPLFLIIDITTYHFIGLILGEEWESAVATVIIYSLIEFLPAIFYPISGVWFITKNQKLNLKYQIYRSLLVVFGLLLGVIIGGYYATLICFGVFRSLSFLIFLIKCISLSKGQ